MIYDPLLVDLGVGNLDSLQLFGLALSLWLAIRLTRRGNLAQLTAAAFFCLLVFLTLLKPNLLPITLLLGAHLWARHGVRVLRPAAMTGAAFGVILVILSCLKFHSWALWLDWFKYARSLDSATLLTWIGQSNFGPAILLSKGLGVSLSGTVAALAAGLGALMALALSLAMPAGDRGLGGWWRAALRSLRDPSLCTSAGVIVLLVVSPLVWSHYYVLALLPALWLLSRRDQWLANLAGGLNLFLVSGVLLKIIPLSLWGPRWIPCFYALTSAPLLVGVLAMMAETPPEAEGHLQKSLACAASPSQPA